MRIAICDDEEQYRVQLKVLLEKLGGTLEYEIDSFSNGNWLLEEADKKDYDIVPDHIEGRSGDKWILLDYKDVVVHVMGREERENYNIEKFWETKRREGEQ